MKTLVASIIAGLFVLTLTTIVSLWEFLSFNKVKKVKKNGKE